MRPLKSFAELTLGFSRPHDVDGFRIMQMRNDIIIMLFKVTLRFPFEPVLWYKIVASVGIWLTFVQTLLIGDCQIRKDGFDRFYTIVEDHKDGFVMVDPDSRIDCHHISFCFKA